MRSIEGTFTWSLNITLLSQATITVCQWIADHEWSTQKQKWVRQELCPDSGWGSLLISPHRSVSCCEPGRRDNSWCKKPQQLWAIPVPQFSFTTVFILPPKFLSSLPFHMWIHTQLKCALSHLWTLFSRHSKVFVRTSISYLHYKKSTRIVKSLITGRTVGGTFSFCISNKLTEGFPYFCLSIFLAHSQIILFYGYTQLQILMQYSEKNV